MGPARARALDRLGILTVGDLLSHYPRRYFDRSATVPIGRARPGTEATVLGEVLTAGDRSTRTGGSLLTVSLGDDSGVLFCVWFNQKYLKNQFRPGRKVMASGLVQRHQGRLQLAHPDFEILDDEGDDDGGAVPAGLHTGRLVPVYGLTSGIGQHWLRALVFQSLERLGPQIPELLPAEMTRRRGLPSRAQALRDIHFPADQRALESARRRLVFEELFTVQLLMALRRRSAAAIGPCANWRSPLTTRPPAAPVFAGCSTGPRPGWGSRILRRKLRSPFVEICDILATQRDLAFLRAHPMPVPFTEALLSGVDRYARSRIGAQWNRPGSPLASIRRALRFSDVRTRWCAPSPMRPNRRGAPAPRHAQLHGDPDGPLGAAASTSSRGCSDGRGGQSRPRCFGVVGGALRCQVARDAARRA
ncbi:MAG: hypothetical protein IPG61_02780 [bacterium]|nr:hypothetical protein [bacterium]